MRIKDFGYCFRLRLFRAMPSGWSGVERSMAAIGTFPQISSWRAGCVLRSSSILIEHRRRFMSKQSERSNQITAANADYVFSSAFAVDILHPAWLSLDR